MAGSTATRFRTVADELRVVTLTVNNRCNLRCPHCYLQYDGPLGMVDESTLDSIWESRAEHVSIVGKEPLADANSVETTERIIAQSVARGKSVSLITNGIGLHRLSRASLASLDWLDVSLDGGPKTYRQYRGGDFARIIENVRQAKRRGARAVNALHTVSTANRSHLADMMAVADLASWDKILFSPYAEVRNHGANATSAVSLPELLADFAGSPEFVRCDSAFLLFNGEAFADQGYDATTLDGKVRLAGLAHKTLCLEHDPLLLGYVRVTYDGYVLTPFQSMHPANYHSFASQLRRYESLDAAFACLRAA